jgi:hypothetical protein
MTIGAGLLSSNLKNSPGTGFMREPLAFPFNHDQRNPNVYNLKDLRVGTSKKSPKVLKSMSMHFRKEAEIPEKTL